MKTFTAPLQQNQQLPITSTGNLVPAIAASAQEILALLSAVTAAAAIVMLSIWVAGMEMTDILGAGIWGLGFIFLGLAVDNTEPKAMLHVVTGISLFVLAWLQFTVSPEYTIISGVIVATWVSVSLFQRLR